MPSLIETSPQAILPLTTVGVTTLTVNVLCDDAMGDGGGADFGVGVYIDGVWSRVLTPTVDGINTYAVAIGGGTHTVDLVNSYQNYHRGSFVYSLSVDAGTATVRAIAPPSRRMVVYTDSIGCGALANPLTQLSWVARLRTVYPGRIAILGWGGRALWDDTGTSPGMMGLGSVANLAARMVAYVRQDVPATREIALAIGTNDSTWGGVGRMSAANFQTSYAALLDAIHALDAGIRVWAITPLITASEAAGNSFGNVTPDYRTAIVAASAGRAWVTVVAGPSLMAAGGLGDTLHPSNAGHQGAFDGSGAFAGSTNLRAVFGV